MSPRKTVFGGGGDGDSFVSSSRGESDMDLDITPMIDVTFLLLIFFMVASTMQGTPDVDVPIAKYGVGIDSKGATIVSIKAPESADATPIIVLGDGSGAEGTLDDVRVYVEESVERNVHQIVIKADREVPHGFVQEVTRVVTSVEGVHFFIGVRDERGN